MGRVIIYSFILFLIDLVSKVIISTNLELNNSLVIIDDFFSLTYIKNYGAAFSILVNYRLLLVIVSIIVIILLIIFLIKNKLKTKLEFICYSLLLGGILGNLFDRVVYGYVIDFFDFTFFGYNFAIFNLADSFIVISIILLLFDSFRSDKK